MNILIVSATRFEIAPLLAHLREHFIEYETDRFQQGDLQITVAITGVGMTLTAYALGRLLNNQIYGLAINAGIAGAFNRDLALGEVVQVTSQQFGDLGAEEADGHFTSIHEMGLIEADQFPFHNGKLINEAANESNFLPKASSITVNRVHGYPPHIEQIREKFPVDIESMEGAAFFYACLNQQQPFLEIRAVSNYVEARNRDHWRIDLAIEKLNEVLIQMVESFR